MTHTNFQVGDLITVTKPQKNRSMLWWNSDDQDNMDYLTQGVHAIYKVGSFIEVWDPRIQQAWTLDKDWCTLVSDTDVNRDSPYYNVIRKSRQLSTRFENRKKGTEYEFESLPIQNRVAVC